MNPGDLPLVDNIVRRPMALRLIFVQYCYNLTSFSLQFHPSLALRIESKICMAIKQNLAKRSIIIPYICQYHKQKQIIIR